MDQLAYLEESRFFSFFAITLGSYARRSPYINLLADLIKEQDKFISQGPVQKSNTRSNKISIKAFIFLEALTSLLIPLSTKNFFTKFMIAFIKLIQA